MNVKITKGYDIRIAGRAQPVTDRAPFPAQAAIRPRDFFGIRPRMLVNEGDTVMTGAPLFCDKSNPKLVFTAPLGGRVSAIRRGERRVIEAVVIATDPKLDTPAAVTGVKPPTGMRREDIVEALLAAGIFPCLRQRPFGTVADPAAVPRDIFVPAMDTAPLAADPAVIVQGAEEFFLRGIQALARLTSGRVHLVLDGNTEVHSAAFAGAKNVERHVFSGPHPAGNAGVHIHHIAPIRNANDIAWQCSVQGVILIGRLFATGRPDFRVTVAIAGPLVDRPCYRETWVGAQIASFAAEHIGRPGTRVISGGPLTGTEKGLDGFLGFYDSLVCGLPEPRGRRLLGWLRPGLGEESFSRSYLSRWTRRSKRFTIDTGMNGGARPFLATGLYETVLPMDIEPMFLFKSILAGDIEEMEGLGIYEIVEEDVALCEYVCPSKSDLQQLVRQGITLLRKEG